MSAELERIVAGVQAELLQDMQNRGHIRSARHMAEVATASVMRQLDEVFAAIGDELKGAGFASGAGYHYAASWCHNWANEIEEKR